MSYEQNANQKEQIQLDETKLKRLKVKLIYLERENLRTKELSNEQMVNKIRRAIEEEVNKCY